MRYEITVTATNDDGTVTDGDRSVFTFPGPVETTERIYRNTVPVAIAELMDRVITRFPERVKEYSDSLALFKQAQTRALLVAKQAQNETEKEEDTNAETDSGKADAGAGKDGAAKKEVAKAPAKG